MLKRAERQPTCETPRVELPGTALSRAAVCAQNYSRQELHLTGIKQKSRGEKRDKCDAASLAATRGKSESGTADFRFRHRDVRGRSARSLGGKRAVPRPERTIPFFFLTYIFFYYS